MPSSHRRRTVVAPSRAPDEPFFLYLLLAERLLSHNLLGGFAYAENLGLAVCCSSDDRLLNCTTHTQRLAFTLCAMGIDESAFSYLFTNTQPSSFFLYLSRHRLIFIHEARRWACQGAVQLSKKYCQKLTWAHSIIAFFNVSQKINHIKICTI